MPFPTDPALEASVIADADDDLPRLVYADWLDEHGDPLRAEFIRVQCALHDRSPADPDFIDLELRQAELAELLDHRAELLATSAGGFSLPPRASLISLIDGGRFARGFPHLAATGSTVPDDPVGMFRRTLAESTLRGLSFSDGWVTAAGEILRLPEAEAVTTLHVYYPPEETGAELEALADSPAIARLSRLVVGTYWGTHVLSPLTGVPFRRLAHLSLPPLVDSPSAVADFVRADWVGRLRSVELCPSPEQPVAALLRGLGELPHLNTLCVHDNKKVGWGRTPLRGFPALARLELSNSNLRGQAAVTLARTPLPPLSSLELTGEVPAQSLTTLAAADWFAGLRSLFVRSQEMTPGGITALARSAAAGRLHALRLWYAKLGEEGCRAVATSFPELQSLELYANKPEAGRPLARVQSPHLRHLSIEGFPLGEEGERELAANPHLSDLTWLRLGGPFTADGVRAILTSPHLKRLTVLELRGKWADGEATHAAAALTPLLDPTVLPHLQRCCVPGRLSDDLRRRVSEARGPFSTGGWG